MDVLSSSSLSSSSSSSSLSIIYHHHPILLAEGRRLATPSPLNDFSNGHPMPYPGDGQDHHSAFSPRGKRQKQASNSFLPSHLEENL